jgi:adenylate cyclase
LREEGSRTVVFDVVFTRATAPPRSVSNSDRAATLQLAAAITNHGRVAIAGTIRELWKGRVKGFTYEAPDGRLKAAGVGVAEMLDERDTTVRLLKTEWRVSGQSYSTLAWEAARIEGAASVAAGTPALGSAWLNYLGPPRTIETVSYDNALNGLPRGYFSNKVVVVGADYQTSVIGAKVDTFRSPFPIGKPRFAGVELHATVLANLLAGDWLRRAPPMVEFLVIALIGGLAGAFLPRLQPLAATGAALGFIALVAALGILLHRQAQFWFPWMIPVAVQIPAALVWAIMFQALRGYVENTLLERSLAHYLSPKQVSLILKHPEQLSLGGQEQRISILFSDIANFSKLSERMDAESLVKLLNEYYAEAIGCVHATDGTVVKLIGDCIFAVWNAPQPQSNHQEQACRAALALHESCVRFSDRPGLPPLRTRIGLHTGTACVGNVGSKDRFDYTAIGEAVNLASRLESLNKTLGTSILATRDALKGLEEQFRIRRLGYFRLQGFDGVADVLEILPRNHADASGSEWQQRFEKGLHYFQRGDLAKARSAFAETLGLRPGDGPACFYVARVEELLRGPLPPDWTGEINLKEK